MKNRKMNLATVLVIIGVLASAPVSAEDDEEDPRVKELTKRVELLEKQAELATQQKELVDAEAALIAARIDALGLPEFENTTELKGANAGQFEATLLASDSIAEAGETIAKKLEEKAAGKPIILLAGDEEVAWKASQFIRSQIDYRRRRLRELTDRIGTQPSVLMSVDPILFSAAITTAAKLFGQTTTVSAVAVSADDNLLARSVTLHLSAARHPDALVYVAPENSLLSEFGNLQYYVRAANQRAKDLGSTDAAKNEPLKSQLSSFKEEIEDAEKFADSLVAPDSKGNIPLYEAARYAGVLAGDAVIARVYSEYSGGSSVTKGNIGTFFGADPVKISGGLVASYSLSEPKTGAILTSGIVTCRTAFTSLRRVQDDSWREGRHSLCSPPPTNIDTESKTTSD